MALPIHSPLIAPRPTTLAQAVAQARHPRNHATAQLEPHREELLRLSQAGESAEALVGGLRLIGVEIGRETMRRWLQRESGDKLPRRKKTRRRPACAAPVAAPASGTATAQPPEEPKTEGSAVPPAPTADAAPSTAPEQSPPVRRSSLILPGETQLQALRRRLAVLDAEKAAKVFALEQSSPCITRDNI